MTHGQVRRPVNSGDLFRLRTATAAEAPVLAVCPNASPYGTIGVGYEMWIESVKLYEGDAPAEPTEPDTPTGDASVIAIAVITVALAAAVVFTKKKVTE